MRIPWKKRREDAITQAVGSDPERKEYADANAEGVSAAIVGRGPFGEDPDPDAGAHAIANIASVHIPSFVRASLKQPPDPKPYKNGYDLKRYRVGDPEPDKTLKRREKVDRALPLPDGSRPWDIYFTAVELNGAGIRFYGDVGLLLRKDRVDANTTILDRNSYELVRDPIATRIRNGTAGTEDQRWRNEAEKLAGVWSKDLRDIGIIKVMGDLGCGARRWTPGQISNALLDDEDYIEVLLTGSFSTRNLSEARIAADDAAYENLIAERSRLGPPPRFESLLWRHQRRNADAALQAARVPVHVAVTSGRVRS
jgi:hypothetical protein